MKSVDGDRWDRMRSRRLTSGTLLLKLEDPEPSPERSHAKPSVEVQTDMTTASVSLLQEELLSAYQQIATLKARLSAEVPFSDQFLQSTADILLCVS